MLRRLALAGVLTAAAVSLYVPALAKPSAQPSPTPTPSPDARAERIFARARAVWLRRSDVPYLRYGALVRYLHNGHVFDNWWDAYYRSDDGALSLEPLHDIAEEKHRLGGVPFSIFGFTFFDTNPDAEPIRLDEPNIAPVSSFGVLTRGAAARQARSRSDEPSASPTPSIPPPTSIPPLGTSPAPTISPARASAAPSIEPAASPEPSGAFREIAHVEANTRDYQIDYVGTDAIAGAPALHLKLTPLRNPELNRLRDVWVDPSTYRTVQLNVQGLLGGKPYDSVEWTIHYVLLDGRNYVQQIVADEPLHFGFDTTVPKFEFDFVDYHFPTSVPQFTFNRSLTGPSRS